MEKEEHVSYERRFKQAHEEQKTSQVSHEFYTWEEEGQVLYCRILDSEEMTSKDYEGTFYRYIADSDDGLIGVIFGSVFDKLYQEKNLAGKIIRVEYLGQKQLDAGRTVNRFRVDIIKE